MWFLRRTDEHPAFWETVGRDAPGALQELARGDRSVVLDRPEGEEAIAWARAQPAWREDQPPVRLVRT